MLVALVIIGDSITLPLNNKLRLPPLKNGSTTVRYDSVNNGIGGHYIVYDNNKAYPGYLITYKIQ